MTSGYSIRSTFFGQFNTAKSANDCAWPIWQRPRQALVYAFKLAVGVLQLSE
jgi:hypothetical protein